MNEITATQYKSPNLLTVRGDMRTILRLGQESDSSYYPIKTDGKKFKGLSSTPTLER
jgi:hypothetical protein